MLMGNNCRDCNRYSRMEMKNINKDFNSTIFLTDTAAYLWNLLKNQNVSKEQMLHGLLDNFDISTVLALNDIDIFIKTLKENGILEE